MLSVGEEKVGGGRDEDSTAIGGKNSATDGVDGSTLCLPIGWTYGRLDTESSGGMAPASPQAPPPSFDKRIIGKNVEGLNCWFVEERRGWGRRVKDL